MSGIRRRQTGELGRLYPTVTAPWSVQFQDDPVVGTGLVGDRVGDAGLVGDPVADTGLVGDSVVDPGFVDDPVVDSVLAHHPGRKGLTTVGPKSQAVVRDVVGAFCNGLQHIDKRRSVGDEKRQFGSGISIVLRLIFVDGSEAVC